MKYDKNAHSIYILYFHLVLVVKYRRKVINYSVSDVLKEIFSRIGYKYGINIEEWNHDIDHIHFLFKSTVKTDFCIFIDIYKSCSSRIIKERFLKIKNKLWKSFFWSPSYCLIATGGASII